MIQPIETKYKGYRFRSRLEARWAVFFDELGVEWAYEVEGFDLGDAGRYLPDFWLPKHKYWVEIKPADAEGYHDKVEALSKESGFPVFVASGSMGAAINWEYYGPDETAFKTQHKPLCIQLDRYFRHETDIKLICPVCASPYIHWGEPEIKYWKRGEEGAQPIWFDAVTIPMWCEFGHDTWAFYLGGGKGEAYIKLDDIVEHTDNLGRYLANWNTAEYQRAINKAKSARFEFGHK